MMLLSILAASFTFTATATGIEKGAPVEFAFVGQDSDRDYEALFFLPGDVGEFCKKIDALGVPRGKPEDVRSNVLWPVGCRVTMKPSLDEYLETKVPGGNPAIVYTGGIRLADGSPEAATNMPLSAFCFYSLGQSPLVFNSHLNQGDVYNFNLAKKTLKKGTPVEFTLTFDEKTLPKHLDFCIGPGDARKVITTLKAESAANELDVLVDFSPDLTVREAKLVASALAIVDSARVKINGSKSGHLFYRAFMPLVKWLDRQQRIVQPFELTLGATNRLDYIDADWSAPGDDPKLTVRPIAFADAAKYKETDTCFIFARPEDNLSSLYEAMDKMKGSRVRTWYVFTDNPRSLHNTDCAK